MFAVKVRMPRTIYINSKNENKDPEFKKVNSKVLPRNRQIFNLYEWETTEENYQEKFQQIMYDHLLTSDIEGIYETKMPLTFRAINDLGCLVKPRQHKIPRTEQALGRTYSLPELETKYNQNESYLPTGSYDKLYLLHFNCDKRHFIGLYNHQSNEIHIACVN